MARTFIRKVGPALIGAAAGAAAGGYYFFVGKGAKRHRHKVAKWVADLKSDVMRQAKTLKDLDRKAILQVVDGVVVAYENVRGLDKSEVARAGRELRSHWQNIVGELQRSGTGVLKRVGAARGPAPGKAKGPHKRGR